MAGSEEEQFLVLINDDEQHALWPAEREFPHGWRAVTEAMSKKACLQFVENARTEMRPINFGEND